MPEINYPDREDLAYALFVADNWHMKPAQVRADYDATKARQAAEGVTFYVYPLADAALDMFRKANP
jgi:hypothetical protein